MNMREAFAETVDIALNRDMPMDEGSPLGLAHLLDMEERISDDFSEAKLGRWLGWAQAAVVSHGKLTLEDMKQINRRYAN
jgi:hypothetical protein